MYVKDYIKIEDLKDGYLYKIIARNASYGIWRAETKGFTISRVKFGHNYAFEEFHYDADPSFGTAQPLEEIEKSPFKAEDLVYDYFKEDGRNYCQFRNEETVLRYLNWFEGGRESW